MRICAVDSFSDRGNTYRREAIATEKMLAAVRLSNIFCDGGSVGMPEEFWRRQRSIPVVPICQRNRENSH